MKNNTSTTETTNAEFTSTHAGGMASCCMMMPPLGSLGLSSVNWKYAVPTTSHIAVHVISSPAVAEAEEAEEQCEMK